MTNSTTFIDNITNIKAAWLNDVNTKTYADPQIAALSAPTGSSLVGFQLSATGAAAQTIFTKASQTVSVTDFYANGVSGALVDPTGTYDSTLGFQAAYNSGAKTIRVPDGIYLFGTGGLKLAITSAVRFVGDSQRYSIISINNTSGDGILVNTTDIVSFENLTFGSQVVRTAGSYITVTAPSGLGNTGSSFYNCNFTNAYNGLNFLNAFNWKVVNCTFSSYTATVVFVANGLYYDHGDSSITGCLFYGIDTAHGYGIYQTSSGGLRVTNNKFLSGITHYYQNITAGASTSILIFANNSCEYSGGSNIVFANAATSSFLLPQIVNNEISVTAGQTGITLQTVSGGTLSNFVIGGNIFNLASGATTGIYAGYVSGLTILPNHFTVAGATSGTGINISANVGTGNIQVQSFFNLSSKVSNSNVNVTDLNNVTNFASPGGLSASINATPSAITTMGTQYAAQLLVVKDFTTSGAALLLLTDVAVNVISSTLTSISFTTYGGNLLAATTGGASSRTLFMVKLSTANF